jgi:hypothetical protein
MNSNIPFPKTRLEDYLNYRKEVSEQVNLAGIRYEISKDKTLYENLKNKIDEIYSRYESKLYPEDLHYFNGIRDLESFLKNDIELKEYKIKEIIRHEKKHLNKMYELGYIASGFGCILLKTKENKITYAIQTHIDTNEIINYTNLVAMASAPKNPSTLDKYHF